MESEIKKSTNVIHNIKKIKGKNQKIISINAEKKFLKNPTPIMLITPNKTGRKENFINLIKGIYLKKHN